ncbi:RagB/SusD family nutrient uptake outer membrane protein [Aquimarina sp. RZ0]|uniref:RagB/SusD family nutrient uptake outer membrane protein n=1 Tax=Aquimarina sp. RZ0 TaxID=2607730 RepID=UPI0011F0B29B|nr:RagB/SusD family nutrient uptake outer membrane protein [Aquimarina sp. RZ0]KAA1247965.1 RagB/SusD family nutrient uptake outer membrane protein [Aquimarina sp. RZ0]
MKAYKILYTFLFLVVTMGCEKELEISPTDNLQGEVAFESEANIASILVGTYDEAGQAASLGGSLQMFVDLIGATNEVNWNGSFLAPRQAFTKEILIDNGFVEGIWRNLYEVINQSNLVIDNLNIVTSSEDEKNRIEGEARFLRSLSYFDLIRNFAVPYQNGQTNSQRGVPLRTEGIVDYSVNIAIAPSSAEEVYDLIISDAMRAYDILPDSNSFFADKYAAQALLARVYFQQGNYAAARDAANDVLRNSGHQLASTYAGAFNNDSDSVEDIFSFQVTSQTGTNQLVIFYASEDDGGRGGDITITDEYLNLFDDANDVRGSFVYINPVNGRQLTQKYRNQFANITVFRIAEMHLIRLESNFREGTSLGQDPLAEINALRARSNAVPLVGPLTSDLIFRERQLELAFEGFILNDVKRTQGMVGTIPFDDESIILPIPQAERDTNPLINQ